MLEWHFCIEGPAGSPYQGGYYHGIIRFPQEYPFKPPSIRMLTPSGRFEPNQRICLSMSDFHPETWNCMWSVSSILQGVVSFMLDSAPAIGKHTLTGVALVFESFSVHYSESVYPAPSQCSSCIAGGMPNIVYVSAFSITHLPVV